MKLDYCLKNIVSAHPGNFTVRFWRTLNDGRVRETTINVIKLYKDWNGECEHCPSNDQHVFGISFTDESTGQVYMIEIDDPDDFVFEKLIEPINEICDECESCPQTFVVEIKETRVLNCMVRADNYLEAVEKVKTAYNKQNIRLLYENRSEVDFKITNMDVDDAINTGNYFDLLEN